MYSTWLMPASKARRAHEAARDAGFDIPLLADYCRSARMTGLIVGFGGVTDDQLARALEILENALAQ